MRKCRRLRIRKVRIKKMSENEAEGEAEEKIKRWNSRKQRLK